MTDSLRGLGLLVSVLALACGGARAHTVAPRPRVASSPPQHPVLVGPRLALARASTCFVARDARVRCWGNGEPSEPMSHARSMVAGWAHWCALDADGRAHCWGLNDSGQLGDGTTVSREAATPVRSTARFESLSAGDEHTCGLAADGRVLCWGRNDGGQLGDGTRIFRSGPVLVDGLRNARHVAAGGHRTCAVRDDGAILCWGVPPDAMGIFSRGRVTPVEIPLPDDVGAIEAIDLGSAHACIVEEDGGVGCIGDDSFGQVGADEGARVLQLPPARAISAGVRSTCAVTRSGELYCWGRTWDPPVDYSDDLAVALPRSLVPIRMGELRDVVEVDVADAHACARLADETVWCWGENANGRVGPAAGEATARAVEVLIAP